MSRPAFVIACLLALGAGVLVTRWLTDGDAPARTVDVDPGSPATGEPEDPDARVGLSGTAPEERHGTSRPPEVGGMVPLDARRPHGIDLSDPDERRRQLKWLLAQAEVDWTEVRAVLAAMQEPLEPGALKAIFDHLRTGPERNRIVLALEMLGDAAGVDQLVAILDDGSFDSSVRSSALRVLATMRGAEPDAVARLLEQRLRGDFRTDVYLIQTMAQRGGTEATRALVQYIESLGGGGDFVADALRMHAVATTPEAIALAREALSRASDPLVIERLLGTFVREDAPDLAPAVLALDRDDLPPTTRLKVLESLARIGAGSALERLLARATEPGDTGRMALDAMRMLSREASTTASRGRIRELLDRADLASDPENVKVTTLRALGALQAVEAVDTIWRHAERGTPRVGNTAIEAIGRMGPKAQARVDDLASLYERGDEARRMTIVRALSSISGERSREWVDGWMKQEGISPQLGTQLRVVSSKLHQDLAR